MTENNLAQIMGFDPHTGMYLEDRSSLVDVDTSQAIKPDPYKTWQDLRDSHWKNFFDFVESTPVDPTEAKKREEISRKVRVALTEVDSLQVYTKNFLSPYSWVYYQIPTEYRSEDENTIRHPYESVRVADLAIFSPVSQRDILRLANVMATRHVYGPEGALQAIADVFKNA